MTEKQEGDFQSFGQCGVRMKVNTNSSGVWKLGAIENNFTYHVISFNVKVNQLEPKDVVSFEYPYSLRLLCSLIMKSFQTRLVCEISLRNYTRKKVRLKIHSLRTSHFYFI